MCGYKLTEIALMYWDPIGSNNPTVKICKKKGYSWSTQKFGFRYFIGESESPKKEFEDFCWTLIDTYKLAVYCQYLFLIIYWSHRRKKLSYFLRAILRLVWNLLYVVLYILPLQRVKSFWSSRMYHSVWRFVLYSGPHWVYC